MNQGYPQGNPLTGLNRSIHLRNERDSHYASFRGHEVAWTREYG